MSVDWHARYLQQARWTRPLREYLYGKAGVDSARRVLEVGCGTGALLASSRRGRQPRSTAWT
jgi:cyclopropane fatty-acyl-phospholipid synthase-like methyltransferase